MQKILSHHLKCVTCGEDFYSKCIYVRIYISTYSWLQAEYQGKSSFYMLKKINEQIKAIIKGYQSFRKLLWSLISLVPFSILQSIMESTSSAKLSCYLYTSICFLALDNIVGNLVLFQNLIWRQKLCNSNIWNLT